MKSLEGRCQEGIHTDAFGVHPETAGVRFLNEACADPDTMLVVRN